MGSSAQAILFYGYCWEEEMENPWSDPNTETEEDQPDWEERYAIAKGLGAYPGDKSDKIRLAYWRDVRKAVEAAGCSVGFHCTYDVSMPYVAITKSEITVVAGEPRVLEPNRQVAPALWRRQLADFCKTLKIKPPQREPRWWLAAFWG